MSKKPKILFLFPPVASPVSPYLSTPLLAGQLKNAGFDVTCLDLSVEFFDYILNKEFLLNVYNKAKEILPNLQQKIGDLTSSDKEFKNFSLELKSLILKKEYIEKVFLDEEKNLELIENISAFVSDYKNKKSFYNKERMSYAFLNIDRAFKLAMLPYFPAKIHFHFYKNSLYKSTYAGLKHQALDKTNNIFYEFYNQKIDEYKVCEYDIVYISCPNETQILPSMTFSNILKKNSNVKVVIGGNIISRVCDELQKIPNLYEEFFDYILCGMGEKTVVSLAEFLLNQKGSLKSIKGLSYKHDGKLVINKPDSKYDINNASIMSLEGIDFYKYFTSDIIMPIQSSKGCYWGKCTFCGLHCPPKKYTIKNPAKMVDELEFLNKQYGINYFEFIDEAIHPRYLEKLADELITRNLNIKYVCCARMEQKYYTQTFCEKLFKSGLRLIQFGYESSVKRVYDSLNKGINFENRLNCIKECANAGIFTYLYAIVGYPNETKEEALKTLAVIDENPDIVDFLFVHPFWLDKKSPAYKNYKKIGIKEVINEKSDIFVQKCNFKTNNEQYEIEFSDVYRQYFEKTPIYKNRFFSSDEYTFLYILHYGRDKAKEILCR